MIGTLFHTHDVPVADRFDYWRELIGRTRSSEMSSPYARDFRAELRVMELGPVTVWPTSVLPTRYRLSSKRTRRNETGLYHLTLLLEGGLILDHAGGTDTFGSGDLHMVDDSRPYDLRPVQDGSGSAVRGVGVDFPKELLPLPSHRLEHVLGRGLPGREGMGALLTGFLTGLEQQAASLQPCDAPRLGAVVLDLVSALLAQAVDARSALPPETRRRTLLRHVDAFIRKNLHDPELSPRAVAAAHHISVSYLHRIFEQRGEGETVAARIRSQRLEGARRDLENPALRALPLYAVGAQWGLPRASDFSRAFRAAYGVSPKEHRLRALQGTEGQEDVPEGQRER
ncbi:MAG TPA: helix-turn-helix domain-containing protein [Streptomyces sp.]|uniref:AraC-like ligand-binding domain-containing protein n=1 Tax=Streptomyces sp. TaxID=1931 RepID=UPI002BDCE76F|nr:helix-turn-helix domain-containing protein [Streptomyces sp.]HWU08605.1 helix-turn-helix domain-containing protein [Streptomyces sp.]